ncbi:MAG: sarcosine oxidase subunit gamma SoxG [Woeseiaceae bacterium]|nr:sarcosine oxidase subunit gamma SoxG [Woeseiaceae bacterium]
MSSVFRQSPVTFQCEAAEKITHDGWEIVLAFEDESEGPWLVDLSHLQRWDFQHANLDLKTPFGLDMPAEPGQVILQDERLVTRMNRTQAAIWNLTRSDALEVPEVMNFTDLTDAHCMLAVLGQGVPQVMENVSNLDLFRPDRQVPFLTQGPIMHIPCQVVTVAIDCVLMTFSRGYGQSFADAMLHAASGCKLMPGGEELFSRWLSRK